MDRRWQAAALRSARMLLGRSLDEVAAAIGVSRPALSQWELGISRPSMEHLERLADCYGMPLDTLLDRVSAPLSRHEWYRQYTQRSARPDYTPQVPVYYSDPTPHKKGPGSPRAADKTVLARAASLVAVLLSGLSLAVLQRQHA